MTTSQMKPTSATAKPSEGPSTQPRAWWQWMLVYPTLVLGILGSVPTMKELIRSMHAEVPFGESTVALQQQDLWAKNMSCYEAPFDGLVNEFNVQVDATICKSGDVLVRFLGPQNKKSYKWVPVEQFATKVGQLSLISEAHAQTPGSNTSEAVVCQWSPSPGIVIRRLRNAANGQCFDEQIKTATGQVVARVQVSCATACGR